MSNHDENISRDEVRQEFQLERLVLFSDAVFAVVITLMAIEIRLPELANVSPQNHITELISHVLPELFAYALSFFFVGAIWSQHLKTFRLLKNYDQGIIVRNLLLLFTVGLFPFSANVISKDYSLYWSVLIYMSVVFLCLSAQYVLEQYILISRPQLRIETDISGDLDELDNKGKSLIVFGLIFILTSATLLLITNPALKPLAILWSLPLVFLQKILNRKRKRPGTVKN